METSKKLEIEYKHLEDTLKEYQQRLDLVIQRMKFKVNFPEIHKERKQIQGIIPICSHCKKIRNTKGLWKSIEEFITSVFQLKLTHSICPECMDTFYPDINKNIKSE